MSTISTIISFYAVFFLQYQILLDIFLNQAVKIRVKPWIPLVVSLKKAQMHLLCFPDNGAQYLLFSLCHVTRVPFPTAIRAVKRSEAARSRRKRVSLFIFHSSYYACYLFTVFISLTNPAWGCSPVRVGPGETACGQELWGDVLLLLFTWYVFVFFREKESCPDAQTIQFKDLWDKGWVTGQESRICSRLETAG